MTAKSLFNIIIKIFGLFFLKDVVSAIPDAITTVLFLIRQNATEEAPWTFIIPLIALIFYACLGFLLLFKTTYFIDKLKLDQGFNQEVFSFNMSTAHILSIGLVVIAGVILITEIPTLCNQLFLYFFEKHMTGGMTEPSISYIIIAAAKVIIALLLIGERKRIIGFIENRRSAKQTGQHD